MTGRCRIDVDLEVHLGTHGRLRLTATTLNPGQWDRIMPVVDAVLDLRCEYHSEARRRPSVAPDTVEVCWNEAREKVDRLLDEQDPPVPDDPPDDELPHGPNLTVRDVLDDQLTRPPVEPRVGPPDGLEHAQFEQTEDPFEDIRRRARESAREQEQERQGRTCLLCDDGRTFSAHGLAIHTGRTHPGQKPEPDAVPLEPGTTTVDVAAGPGDLEVAGGPSEIIVEPEPLEDGPGPDACGPCRRNHCNLCRTDDCGCGRLRHRGDKARGTAGKRGAA